MSDTSIDEELPMAEGAERRMSPLALPLGADIQRVIELAGTVGSGGEVLATRLDRAGATELVARRIYDLFAADVDQPWTASIPVFGRPEGPSPEQSWFAAAIADLVVRSLEDDQLVDAALAGLDLRPYMALAAQNPEAVIAESQVADVIGGQLGDIDAYEAIRAGDGIDLAAVADQAIELFTADQVATITELRAAQGGAPLTQAELVAIQEFGPEMVGATPVQRLLSDGSTTTVNPDGSTTTTTAGAGATLEDILAGAGDDVLDDGPVFDRAMIEQWARTGITDLGQLAEQEARAVQEGVLGQGDAIYGFDVGQYRGGGPRRGPVRAGSTMSAVDAMDYLHTLTPAEFAAMQDRLAAAGYFERLGARPERGYQWDEATNNAWRLALQDSLQRGVAIPQMIQQMTDELATRKQQRMQAFSVKDTRYAANQMAIEVLGRNLTGDEYDQVRSYLKGLQAERRDDILGRDEMTWQREGMDMDMGFDGQDVQEGVMRAIGGEADAQQSWDTMRRINDFLGLGGPTEEID